MRVQSVNLHRVSSYALWRKKGGTAITRPFMEKGAGFLLYVK